MFGDLIKRKEEGKKVSISLCSFDEKGNLIARRDFKPRLDPDMKSDLGSMFSLDLEDQIVDILKDDLKDELYKSGIVRELVKEVFGL